MAVGRCKPGDPASDFLPHSGALDPTCRRIGTAGVSLLAAAHVLGYARARGCIVATTAGTDERTRQYQASPAWIEGCHVSSLCTNCTPMSQPPNAPKTQQSEPIERAAASGRRWRWRRA